MPYVRPSLTSLVETGRTDLEARMPGADSRLPRSVLDALARVFAGALSGVYGLIDWVSRQILPDTADREHLDRWASVFGVVRKAAVPAGGPVTLTGSNGSIVPSGTVIVRSDGAEYATAAAATIAGGTATVEVNAVDAGSSGNAIAGQRLTFASPIAGINATALVAAPGLTGGDGEESDDALRDRLLLRIRRPPHGGNLNDYRAWALEVAGVTRAWVYPAEQGPGSVVVRFVMDGRVNIIPEPADVALVQAHIDAVRPVTAELAVLAPVPVPQAMTIKAVPPTPQVQAAIAEELADLYRREAEPGGAVLISHVRESISLAAGELDHEVIAPTGNIIRQTGELTVPGPITWV